MFANTKNILITFIFLILAIFILLALTLYFLKDTNFLFANNYNFLNNTNQTEQTPEDLFNQGNFSALNALLDEKLLTSPSDISLLLQKAQALAQEASLTFREKELGDQALIYIDQALSLDPKSVEALTLKGYVYEIQEDYVKAHAYYDEALAINPDFAQAHFNKGHAYDLMGEMEKANTHYTRANELDPSNVQALAGLARLATFQGDAQGAHKLFLEVANKAQTNRQKADAYYSAGFVIQDLTTPTPDSEALMRKSIELDPNYAPPHVGLASELFKKFTRANSPEEGQLRAQLVSESFAAIQTAMQINPNQATAHRQLALQFLALGQVEQFKQIAKNLPNIIDKDITLNANDKYNLKEEIKAMSTLAQ